MSRRTTTDLVLFAVVCIGCKGEPGAGPPAPTANAPPSAPAVSTTPAAADVLATAIGPVTIVPVHHATLLLRAPDLAVYVDPTPEGKYDGTKADIVLVTHEHPDHDSPKTVTDLRKSGTVVVAPAAAAEGLGDVVTMKNGDTRQIRGVTIEAVPAYNLKRGPAPGKLYHDKGRGNGYVLTIGAKRIYVAGDTECTDEMRALRSIDVAFVPMNLPYTMPPSEAIECVRAFKPRVVYPYHFRGSDPSELAKAFGASDGIEVRLRSWY